jgi:alanyl-tRNA synthetase
VTKRLYFDNAYAREFRAEVVEISAREGKPAVALDQTCFYPESGGQPSDRGRIDGAAVLRVIEEDGKILHILDQEPASREVRGTIDWPRRFDHMQQHSGQHILSQCFIEVLDGETKSFHLGELTSTLEIGIATISAEALARVEGRANEVIWDDREIKTYFVSQEKIESVPLRRPPKKAGTIRVVEIDGFDYSACGGTHCRRTGEIGLIKVTKWDKIRSNLRFEFLCGQRAFGNYVLKDRIVRDVVQKFSVQEKDAAAAVEKTLQEAKQARKKIRELQEALAGRQASEMIEKAKGGLIRQVWTEKSPDEARFLALNIVKMGAWIVLFAACGEAQDHLIFASSEKLALNMRDLVPVVLSRGAGKGGGSPSLVEVAVEKGADLDALLDAAAEWVRQRLF